MTSTARRATLFANALARAGGGHTWLNWRSYLADLAPQLFR